MKRLLLIVLFALLGSFGNTFANDPIQNNGPHTLGSLNCDITSNVVYYEGTQGIYPADNFDGDTGFHRKISVVPQNSWYSIANNGLFNAPSFQFTSNGKPKNQGTVTAVAATSAASIGTTIPAGYQRSQIAAQIVYHLKRRSYVDGSFPVPVYFTPVGGSTQNVTMNTSPNASSTQEENECRNIHVAFCGDGIRDNGTASSSSNINTPLNGGEQCDGTGQAQCAAGNICNQTTCQCEQQPVGECGTVNGQTYYAFGDNGTALTQTTAGLCPAGQAVTNWAFNQTTHTFSWKCQGAGGLSPLCSATESYCGDGILGAGIGYTNQEECDGTGQAQCSAGSTCNQTTCQCQQQPAGQCGTANGQTYYAFGDNGTALTQTTAGLCPAGQTVTNWAFNQTTHTFSWKCQGAGGLSPLCSATESYCGDGILGAGIGYTNQEECDGTGQAQCSAGSSCNQNTCDCQQLPPGICGTADGQTYYAFNDNGTALTQTAAGLCPTGQTVTNRSFNQTTHTFSRQCQGAGGNSQSCDASESYCGDGILGEGIGYTNQEECDDGNTNPFDNCLTYNNGVATCEEPYCGDGYVQITLGELCDDGNTINGDGCEANCTLPSTPGVCGNVDGTPIYDFNNSGDALTINSPGLCSAGTVANFTYNPTTHTWSWSCVSPNGGQNDICNTTELRCGNNVIDPNSGESCDGVGQAQCGSGQTCQSCVCVGNPTDGVCGSVDTITIYDANNAGDALNASSPGLCAQGTVTNFAYNPTTHTWSRSCDGEPGGQDDTCQASEARCGNNIVDPNSPEECDGTAGQCPVGQTCNTAVCYCVSTPPPVLTGACGAIDNTWIYDFDNSGDALTGGTPGLCAAGNVSLFVYNPTTHLWTWQCVGNGGTDICTVGERRCGNGVVEAGTSEQCDDGNTIDNDACTNQCTTGEGGPGSGHYDLALTKIIQGTKTSFTVGEYVTFIITVFNQGTLPAQNITITDYIPAGLSLSDTAWTTNGNNATYTHQGIILPGASMQIPIRFQIMSSATGTVINRAEISADDGDDTDSTPDSNQTDCYKQDNYILGNAKADTLCNSLDDDEDDHDPATITILGEEGNNCVITVTPVGGSTNRNLPYTGAVQCVGISADTASISCGNGNTINNISGECVYTSYGTYTIQCLKDGLVVPDCSAPLTLRRGGGGTDSSIKCGNGKIDPGEQCDDGIKNGISSICTTSCTLKGNPGGGGGGSSSGGGDGSESTPPKCAFVDPPSIQMGEILPFRRGFEPDSDVQRIGSCSSSNEGVVSESSMMCHFTIESPDGKKYTIEESCNSQKLKSAVRYNDFISDTKTVLESSRGKSWTSSKDWKMSAYGEYTITLDKITYALCEEATAATAKTPATYRISPTKTYEGRVCQFNFAVTTPYFIQKGTALSSLPDDKKTLESFRRIDGRTILEMSSIETIDNKSDSTAFADMKANVYKQAFKAVQGVTVANPLGSIDPTFKKIPSQEVYVIKKGFTLTHYGKKPFNDGKPTTIVLQGPGEIVIKGSLPGNVLLVAPEGTVLLENTDCDHTDTIEATIVASAIKSKLQVANPNTSISDSERCVDGKLVVKGVVVTENTNSMEQIRDVRRSTLNNWFDGKNSKAEHIYAGAAFRIDTRPGTRSALPPLAKSHKLFFTTQGHESAPEMILNDVVLALFEVMN